MIPTHYQYRECRGMLRHAWHEVPSDWATGTDLHTPFTIRCERCDTERRDIIGANTGEIVSRRYYYPPYYRIDQDKKPKIADFRLAWLDDHMAQVRTDRKKRRGGK